MAFLLLRGLRSHSSYGNSVFLRPFTSIPCPPPSFFTIPDSPPSSSSTTASSSANSTSSLKSQLLSLNSFPSSSSRLPFSHPAEHFPILQPPNYSILHVHASNNNTIVSISDSAGNVHVQSSGGKVGYKKGMRAGFEPAYKATQTVLDKMETKFGPECKSEGVVVKFKGFGPGREAAWKCVQTCNWHIVMVEDVTPIPHGGCRPKKKRRL